MFEGKGNQVWNDKQITVDDSFERYSGYEYFGIIDHDEFFIPGKNKTLPETLVGGITDIYFFINRLLGPTLNRTKVSTKVLTL